MTATAVGGAHAEGVKTWGGIFQLRALSFCAISYRRKFCGSEYDENTWATRTWLTFVTQRVSVVLHKAVAAEVRAGCRVGAAETSDVRGKWVGGEVGGGEGEGE